jgi:hypothetical protein
MRGPEPIKRLLNFIDPAKPVDNSLSPNISIHEMLFGPTGVETATPAVTARGQVFPPMTMSVATQPTSGCQTCDDAPIDLMSVPQVFKKCEKHAVKTPCTGHGDLSGYRFARPIVHPCPPLLPLFVKDCSNTHGAGSCDSSPAMPVIAPSDLAASSRQNPRKYSDASQGIRLASQPLTHP